MEEARGSASQHLAPRHHAAMAKSLLLPAAPQKHWANALQVVVLGFILPLSFNLAYYQPKRNLKPLERETLASLQGVWGGRNSGFRIGELEDLLGGRRGSGFYFDLEGKRPVFLPFSNGLCVAFGYGGVLFWAT